AWPAGWAAWSANARGAPSLSTAQRVAGHGHPRSADLEGSAPPIKGRLGCTGDLSPRHGQPSQGGHAFHGLPPAVRVSERGERGVKISTERAPFVGFRTMAWVAILVGLLGSASPAQPVLLGGAPTLSSAGYRVTLESPQTIFQGQDAAVVVR